MENHIYREIKNISPELSMLFTSILLVLIGSGCAPEQAIVLLQACIDANSSGHCEKGELPVEGLNVDLPTGIPFITKTYKTDENGRIGIMLSKGEGIDMTLPRAQDVIIDGQETKICDPKFNPEVTIYQNGIVVDIPISPNSCPTPQGPQATFFQRQSRIRASRTPFLTQRRQLRHS